MRTRHFLFNVVSSRFVSMISVSTFYSAFWNNRILVGRFIFFALLMIQSGFLAAYPATYRDQEMAASWLLCIPPLFYCLCTEASLQRMFFTWGLYLVVFLIPIIAIIFAVAGDDLDKEKFLGPNALKVTLCLTPVLFLFLPNIASDLSGTDDHRQLAFRLTIQVTIDWFVRRCWNAWYCSWWDRKQPWNSKMVWKTYGGSCMLQFPSVSLANGRIQTRWWKGRTRQMLCHFP